MAKKPAAQPAPANLSSPTVNVFAVHGVEPEVQAYAMAKYSRSALSMRESLKEISEQKAEQFLNTFYFQYGHRSIADLAHIALAIERLSILAAIAIVDEPRWDGRDERGTRGRRGRDDGPTAPQHRWNGEVGIAPEHARNGGCDRRRIVHQDTEKLHQSSAGGVDPGGCRRNHRAALISTKLLLHHRIHF